MSSTNSSYLQLPSDVLVDSAAYVLTKSLNFTAATKVYVQSDGRFYPNQPDAIARVQILVDGNIVGNPSIIDWSASSVPVQHSFNCIGAITLPAGTHVFTLQAETLNNRKFYIGSTTNLSIMTNPAENITSATLSADSQMFDFTTGTIYEGMPVPHTPVLSCQVDNNSGPVIVCGSGRAYLWGNGGDAMMGIYCDGQSIPNDKELWTVNDLYSGAENQAPLYTHAYLNETGRHTISLDATEGLWNNPTPRENTVQYRVGSGSSLVCLSGGMKVHGKVALSNALHSRNDYLGVGEPWHPFDSNVEIAAAAVNIPSNHNGVVLFMTKSRVQGDAADTGGIIRLWIEVDGYSGSSVGVQEIKHPSGDSQRTICASYLAAGENALKPGNHVVKVYAKVSGSFRNFCMVKDLPLIWFD